MTEIEDSDINSLILGYIGVFILCLIGIYKFTP